MHKKHQFTEDSKEFSAKNNKAYFPTAQISSTADLFLSIWYYFIFMKNLILQHTLCTH